MPTETDKQDALVDFLESTLNAVEDGVRVAQRFREARTAQKAERDDVMGDPPYYLEVDREGYVAGQAPDETVGEAPYYPVHTYGVKFWYGYEDTDRNKTDWDSLVESDNGLLPNLRQKEHLTDGDDIFALGQPTEVVEVVVSLSNREPNGELARYLEFSIAAQHEE